MNKKIVAVLATIAIAVVGASAFAWHEATKLSPEEEAALTAELDAEINAIAARIEERKPLTILAKHLAYARLDHTQSIRSFCISQYSSSSRRASCEAKQHRTLSAMIDVYQDSLDNDREGMARQLNICTENNTRRGLVDWSKATECVIEVLQGAIEADRRAGL